MNDKLDIHRPSRQDRARGASASGPSPHRSGRDRESIENALRKQHGKDYRATDAYRRLKKVQKFLHERGSSRSNRTRAKPGDGGKPGFGKVLGWIGLVLLLQGCSCELEQVSEEERAGEIDENEASTRRGRSIGTLLGILGGGTLGGFIPIPGAPLATGYLGGELGGEMGESLGDRDFHNAERDRRRSRGVLPGARNCLYPDIPPRLPLPAPPPPPWGSPPLGGGFRPFEPQPSD